MNMNFCNSRSPLLSTGILAALVCSFLLSTTEDAAAQAAPSGVHVSYTIYDSSNVAFRVEWTDNSTNENGFRVDYSSGSTSGPWNFLGQVGANQTSFVTVKQSGVFEQPGTFLVVNVGAYAPGGTTVSNNSSSPDFFLWPNPAATVFNAPTNLAASFPSTNTLRLSWTDNSNSEAATEVWAKDMSSGSNPFVRVVDSDFNVTVEDYFYVLQPGKTYQIQIRMRNFAGAYTSFTDPITVVAPGVINNTPPMAPANLTVAAQPSGANRAYGLSWDDRSTDEVGFEISEKLSSETTWRRLQIVSGDTPGTPLGIGLSYIGHFNNSGNVVLFAPNEVFDFRVRAVRGNGPFAIFSDFATVLSTTQGTLDAPSNVRLAAPSDNGLVQLFWSDNSTTEDGVEFEYRVGGTGEFVSRGFLSATSVSRYQEGVDSNTGPFPPSTLVEFRLRAYQGPVETRTFSGYSSAGSVTMPPMAAPTNLVATATTESNVNLTWTDNSGNELGYKIQRKLTSEPDTSYETLTGRTAANATSQGIFTPPGLSYTFRIFATNQLSATSPDINSAFSNPATVTTQLNAPTNFQFTAGSITDKGLTLTWTDNSAIEDGYEILARPAGTTQPPSALGSLAQNATTATLTSLVPGTAYDLFVRAFFKLTDLPSYSNSANSSSVTTTIKDGTTSDLSPPMFVGEAFSHAINLTTTSGTITSSSITSALPPGITFNSTTNTLSGTPTTRGGFVCPLLVNWSNGYANTFNLHLRPIHRPGRPVVANAINAETLTIGGTNTATVSLASTFSDPDSESAVSIAIPGSDGSPSGRTITVILNDTVNPLTVDNFRAYLNNTSDGYTNSIFHRLVPNFILQGGSYRSVTGGSPPNAFVSITKLAAVQNEPGITNSVGTIAMAKVGGDPNSATTDFFFNLSDNAANLDFQNEGFTVFGRVTQSSLSTLGVLNSLPLPPSSGNASQPNYPVTIDGQSTFLTELPTNVVSASQPPLDTSKLLRINAINSAVPVLSGYTVAGNSNPAAVSASITGTDLNLTALATGISTISIQVTDLDGNQLLSPASFTVTINNSLSNWANTENIPLGQQGANDDPDRDGRTNLLEYALMTGPTSSDGNSQPTVSTITDGADKKGTITFKVRKFAALTYTVQGSSTLTGWSTIWTTADGFAAPTIVSAVDNVDHTLVTVKDTTPYSPNVQRFLQVVVTSP